MCAERAPSKKEGTMLKRLIRGAFVSALVMACGCAADQPGPDQIAASSEAIISDEAHGGLTGLFFLPPLVPAATLTGTFDATLSPVVEIDQIDPTTGNQLGVVATFSTTSGSGSETVRVDTSGADYIVNWHTRNYDLSTSLRYRIRVLLGSKVAGFADVDVVATRAELKNVNTQQYVPLLDDGTLQIKFFLNGCAPVSCSAIDACHGVGTCDPVTVTCSNPVLPDGTSCDDHNACTHVDQCASGACVGSNPVVCTASDACHVAGVCDPSSGQCSNPVQPDGTSCDDGNLCTQLDICAAGVCGGTPVVCDALDECHVAGVCGPSSGQCSSPSQPDGTACSSGTCEAGVCAPAAGPVCSPMTATLPGGPGSCPTGLDCRCSATDPSSCHCGLVVIVPRPPQPSCSSSATTCGFGGGLTVRNLQSVGGTLTITFHYTGSVPTTLTYFDPVTNTQQPVNPKSMVVDTANQTITVVFDSSSYPKVNQLTG
jgi:hypothetical protein